jgi:hypothetical protein
MDSMVMLYPAPPVFRTFYPVIGCSWHMLIVDPVNLNLFGKHNSETNHEKLHQQL